MSSIKHGVFAGITASAVFGLLMLVMMPATLGKIAKLYGLSGQVNGFIIHLVHGGLIGWAFTWFVSSDVSLAGGSMYGLLYGLIWWVLGPILIMPTWLAGSPRLSAEGVQAALPSLPGHLVFGLILGLLVAFWSHPSTSNKNHKQEA